MIRQYNSIAKNELASPGSVALNLTASKKATALAKVRGVADFAASAPDTMRLAINRQTNQMRDAGRRRRDFGWSCAGIGTSSRHLMTQYRDGGNSLFCRNC